jgi:hypothetical protein
MGNYIFQQISKDGAKANVKPGTIDARDWFRDRASQVAGVNDSRLMTSGKLQSRLTGGDIGRMYMYFYDAKHKETLPYWDKFPLIFVMDMAEGGHMGLNLHYLPPMYRARLMDSLYKVEENDSVRESKKIQLSYKMLKAASRFKYFKPCVKRYLRTHIKSRFLYIPYEQWDIALMLPTARFQKSSTRKVWADSIKKV